MKKIKLMVFLGALLLLFTLPSQIEALQDPALANCVERGYMVEKASSGSQYCVFPNGSKCLLNQFNQGECGQEFMTPLDCIHEGPIWSNGVKCCKGLARKKGEFQDYCQVVEPFIDDVIFPDTKSNNSPFFIPKNILLLLVGAIVLLSIGYMIGKKRQNKNNTKRK